MSLARPRPRCPRPPRARWCPASPCRRVRARSTSAIPHRASPARPRGTVDPRCVRSLSAVARATSSSLDLGADRFERRAGVRSTAPRARLARAARRPRSRRRATSAAARRARARRHRGGERFGRRDFERRASIATSARARAASAASRISSSRAASSRRMTSAASAAAARRARRARPSPRRRAPQGFDAVARLGSRCCAAVSALSARAARARAARSTRCASACRASRRASPLGAAALAGQQLALSHERAASSASARDLRLEPDDRLLLAWSSALSAAIAADGAR